ncbi:FixH family protein [Aquimarina brevivitae]|uniref:FixH protein n=1 Tax=Aquimarina brevivitae TaxID=323412 RepID=A0A4Q7PI90_9FLAO|nr:FixH family protein [Aquimarina brevivitae]RZS99688.1 hypothetical protein EV197_0911 [Aquimarina brevivitae]
MKINWGTGIVIAFVCFISFILFFVVRMNTEDKYSHDLVTDDYYKKELAFQDEINALKNANSLSTNVTLIEEKGALRILFPYNNNVDVISGYVDFYRPSDKKLDFKLPIRLSESAMVIPTKHLAAGRWDITISWQIEDEKFLIKKSIKL